jgi:hypothetical protein
MASPLWAATKDWSDGSDNWSTDAAWTPVGVPAAGDNAHIIFSDGVARTVTYDYAGPAIVLGNVSVDLTGPGTDATILTMSAGELTTSFGQSIGPNGRGTFNQTGGKNSLNTLALRLGDFASSNGVYNLSGTGILAANTDEIVGYSGTGTVNQSGGTNTITGADEHLYLGANGGTGNYSLTGGSLSAGIDENVGFFGTGNFDHSAGTNLVAGNLDIGVFTAGTGTYTLGGTGQLTTNTLLRVGNAGIGTFGQTGGTNNAAALTVGAASGGLGTYTLGAGTLVVSGSEIVAANATGNGTQSGGTFQQSGGTHQVNALTIAANANSNGAFTLGGGSLVSTTTETIGNAGTATFSQSGGVNTAATIAVGVSTGSTGSYSLNGGSANANNIYLGGTTGGSGGAGALTVAGSNSILTVPGTIKVYNTSGTSFGLQSGTVNVGAINVGGVPSRFNWTGGTLNITNDLALDSGAAPDSTGAAFGSSVLLSSSKILRVTGSETIGGNGAFTVTLGFNNNPNAIHSVTGNITLKPGGTISAGGGNITYANLTQAGGTVSGSSFRNFSNFNYQSGSFTAMLINDGTVTFGPSFSVGSLQNESSFTVSNGQVLTTTSSPGITNSGTFTVNAGTLSTQFFTNTGTATFTNGGFPTFSSTTITNTGNFVMNGGTIPGGTVTNSGTFGFNGGTIQVNTFTNSASGSITGHGSFSGQLVNHGTLTVDGAFTFTNSFAFTQDGILQGVGTISNGNGGITITNSAGGVINSTTPNGSLSITNFSTNNAGAIINVGPTSSLSLTNSSGGSGSWTNSGTVNLQGPGARLTGGTISLLNNGILQGAGLVTAPISSSNSGIIRASGGELDFSATGISTSTQSQIQVLTGSTINFLQGLFTNGGTISLFGGTYENSGKTLSNSGTINGYGTIRTGGLTNNSGRLISVGEGNMDVVGNVTNNGTISIQSGRTAYFWNNVSGSGSFTGTGTAVFLASLSPGNSPAQVNFAGGATLGGGTALNMELGGNTVGTGYDKIDVEGQLSIGGVLSVSLINGFTPKAWSTFDLLDWGTLAGAFSSINLPTLALGQWDTSKLYIDGTLSVSLSGDFNHDAMVDNADYVTWRKGLGTIYTAADYEIWRAHFGDGVSGTGSGTSTNAATIPEPATCALLILAAFSFLARRNRQDRP